jgi:DHA2 family multidrug resistance protein
MAAAFIMIGLALLLQSSIPPNVNFATLSFYRVLQVMPLPFVFIPVNSICYVGVPPQNNGEASALINQSRNLGSSVGISFVNTLLAYREQFHHARLSESITPYTSQHGLTMSQIAPIVQRQADFLSYLDMFFVVGVLALLLWPLVLLLKSPPKPGLRSAS